LAEQFMRQMKLMKEMMIEKMAERPMPDIMQQGCNSYEFFHKMTRWYVRDRLAKRGIESGHKPTCQVHGSKGMLEPSMLGARINPMRALKLENISKALNPGRINQIFFGLFGIVVLCIGNGDGNIAVDRVGKKRDSIKRG
jgi:hypothetical protein